MKKLLLLILTLVTSIVAWDADAAETATTWAELSELFANASADADTPTEVTLDCATWDDYIRVSSYNNCTVTVAAGKALIYVSNCDNKKHTVIGTLTAAQIADIEGSEGLTKGMSWNDLKTRLVAGQSVILNNDVMRVNSDCIEPSGTVMLDLNGYTIDGGTSQTNPLFRVNNGVSLTITDSQTGGNLCNAGTNPTVAVNGGTLTLAAGTINAQSGGVIIWGGNFNMTGGIITGGISNGVYLYGNDGSFTMSGGSITGNDVGVDVNSANATFTVSGNVNITGNTKDVNLNYNGSTLSPINIGGALNEAARIGINIDDYAASDITGDVVKVITNGLEGKGTKQNFVLNGRDGHALVTNANGEVGIAKAYTLTVPENVTVSGITAETDGTYKVGYSDIVTLSYDGEMPAGYAPVYSVNGAAIVGNTFTMPAEDAAVTVEVAAVNYAVTISGAFEHGSVVADKETATIGETVTLTVIPDEGYELETLIVTFTNEDEPSGAPLRLRGGTVELTPGENGTYTFQMPAAPVTVNATFQETVVTSVEDINAAQPKSGQRYNVMGQPVGKDYKGVVIENGKKIIVR